MEMTAMAALEPTSEELHDLSLACSKVWELDNNRLEPGRDIDINLQVMHPSQRSAGQVPHSCDQG